MKTLRETQVADLGFMMANRRCADLSDPGTGKTPTACIYMYWMWKELGYRTAWAMPKSLLEKNREELLEWAGWPSKEVVIYDGTPEQRKKLLAESEAKVWLMGFSRFSEEWKLVKKAHKNLDALVVDEIQLGYKGPDSKRTQGFYQAMNKIDRFLAMTGTLVDGPLDSAYSTIHVIEPRYYFEHRAFMMQHGVYDEFGKLVGWQNHWKLGEIFRRHAIRHTFKEIYGDVEIVPIIRVVEMERRQREAYDRFHAEAMLELEDTFLDGSQDGVATIRARQIMAHPERIKLPTEWNEEGKPTKYKAYSVVPEGTVTGKDEQLMLDLDDAKRKGEPLIIFAALQPEQERIAKIVQKAGLRVGLINGNVPAPERGRIDQQFKAGLLDVVVASQETAAVGYNWGHVDHIIVVSIDYKNTNWTQGLRRAIRGTRDKPLRVSLYKYRNSVDHRIFQIVDRKSEDAHLVDETQAVLNLSTWGRSSAHPTLETMYDNV